MNCLSVRVHNKSVRHSLYPEQFYLEKEIQPFRSGGGIWRCLSHLSPRLHLQHVSTPSIVEEHPGAPFSYYKIKDGHVYNCRRIGTHTIGEEESPATAKESLREITNTEKQNIQHCFIFFFKSAFCV